MNERHSRCVDCVGLEMNIKSKVTQFTSLITVPFHYQFLSPVILITAAFLTDTIKSCPTFPPLVEYSLSWHNATFQKSLWMLFVSCWLYRCWDTDQCYLWLMCKTQENTGGMRSNDSQ